MSDNEIHRKINSAIAKSMRTARNRCFPKIGARWLAHILQWRNEDYQSYETGRGGISAAELWEFAHALNRPIQDFFPKHNENFMPKNIQVKLNARSKLVKSKFMQSIKIDAYIGNSVCMIRQKRGIRRNELANKLEIPYRQMQQHETGDIRIPDETLEEIASILGCSKNDFLPPGYYEK